MRVVLLLADAAQPDNNGKVSALGIGWTRTAAPSPPLGVLLFVDLSIDEVTRNEGSDRGLDLKVELYAEDGSAVTIDDGIRGRIPFSFIAQTPPLRVEDLLDRSIPVRIPIAAQLGPGLVSAPGQYYFRATAAFGDLETVAEEVFVALPGPPAAPVS